MSAKESRKGSVIESLGDELEDLFSDKKTDYKPEEKTEAINNKKENDNSTLLHKETNNDEGSDVHNVSILDILKNSKQSKTPRNTSIYLKNLEYIELISLFIKSCSKSYNRKYYTNSRMIEKLINYAKDQIVENGTDSSVFKYLAKED